MQERRTTGYAALLLVATLVTDLAFASVMLVPWNRTLVLQPASIGAVRGHAFLYRLPAYGGLFQHRRAKKSTVQSRLSLREDGRVLGPAHELLPSISETGNGSYLHWGTNLYFSASDNTDPRTNGRRYVATGPVAPTRSAWLVIIGLNLIAAVAASRAIPIVRLSISRMLSAVGLVVVQGWRTAVLLGLYFVIIGGVYIATDVTTKKRLLNNDAASIAVFEQLQRARRLDHAEILVIGDSACLVGIDFQRLQAAIQRRVVSLCSIGYLGPEGYATLFDIYSEKARERPKAVILSVQPESLIREADWDGWHSFLDAGGGKLPAQYSQQVNLAKSWLQTTLLGTFLQIPMKGTIGLYYGSIENLREDIVVSGAMIIPGASLGFGSLSDFLSRLEVEESTTGKDWVEHCKKFEGIWPNQRLRESLKVLRRSLERKAGIDVFLLLMPLPEICAEAATLERWRRAEQTILKDLGVKAGRVIAAPRTQPTRYFSDPAHLNRFGREIYTDLLSDFVQKALEN